MDRTPTGWTDDVLRVAGNRYMQVLYVVHCSVIRVRVLMMKLVLMKFKDNKGLKIDHSTFLSVLVGSTGSISSA